MDLQIKRIRSKMIEENLDGFLVSSPANITYLTKYSSRDSYYLVSAKNNFYFTDSRYTDEAKNALKNSASIIKTNGSVFKIISDLSLKSRLQRIAFEERHLPFAEYQQIKKGLGRKAKLIPTHSLIEQLRCLKDPQEVTKIRKAIKITAKALDLAKKFISAGKKEIEVVAELERYIRYLGASNSAFDIIVASGPNSSFPHHISGNRKIQRGEPVLIDIGVEFSGYKSDLTRVFFLGRISSSVSKVYDIVSSAQREAIKRIRPQEKISKIDQAARQYISDKGYGGFFSHNLGHGIGLEIHEEPQISSKNNELLSPSMVFTIEPGIYLANKFGIRIEDVVLVTKNGCEVLSGAVHK
ncbi:MAG: Xaa-Pro peptidase family protein [Candidatus Omnitrophota bacterium]